jgi:hypothetical protein
MKNLDLIKLKKVGLAMIKFTLLFLIWMSTTLTAFAVGGIIAGSIFGGVLAGTFAGAVLAFTINMVASMIISKIFAPNSPNQQSEPNVGNRQQIPPAGDNKLPVVYGSAWVGGIIVDMTISKDNQDIYWVFALSEVTNSENGNTPDVFTFGDVYWAGKKCVFSTTAGETYKVVGLLDESTNLTQDISGYMDIYLYRNGSGTPTNSSLNAISVMSSSGLVYTWDGSKLMTNCAFAIVHLKYSQSRNLVSLNPTRFQVINPRNSAGDCIQDYLTSTRYGAAISIDNIDTASITALNTYSNGLMTYNLYSGGASTQPRFKFNGTIDTSAKIMNNIQAMADCCDCLIRYSEITSLWGVIVQKPTNTIAMNINDSNMVSAISISPIDLSNSFNIIEVKFPDSTSQDSFNSASFDLAVINPSLLFPNEPVNKQSVSLVLCNNNVQAQYLANRFLEAAREDLQMQVDIDYTGLQLDAGDIVTVTNSNYGWVAKEFRIGKVTQKFNDGGQVIANLNLMEFNGAVYDDKNVTQFTPAPNTGIGSPITFGVVPPPYITTPLASAANPAFTVNVTSATDGITQYAEVWYSAFQYPTSAQRILAGTTEVNANGDPYGQGVLMPAVQLFNIPAGNWYFFSRMVNSIASSDFSLASSVLQWRPTTFQYNDRYLSVAYATSITGTGFSLDPRNKTYFGLFNTTNSSPSLNASDYKWYLADPAFGTNIYLAYINYSNRKFGFDSDFATYAGGTNVAGSGGAFVPTTVSKFDFRIWSALPDGTNIIDLDRATGQTIITGMPSASAGQIAVQNTPDGQLVASLAEFLTFPDGGSTFTSSAATITVDIYGRIVGFAPPDNFYFNQQAFTATSGQTVFTPTARVSGYITGQDLIFKNGLLLDTSEYTETSTTFTLSVGATTGDIITCITMRAVAAANTYTTINLTVASSSTNTVVWDSATMPWQLIDVGDKITFANTGTPTQYTVTGVNYTTRTITFSTSVTVSAGATIYQYRAAGSSYRVFSRWAFDLTSAGSYTPTTWAVHSAYELLFLNGTVINEQDYDITSGAIANLPSAATGKMTMIQFSANNLTTPTGTISNVIAYASSGVVTYSFNFNPLSFALYINGALMKQATDYTIGTNNYSLATNTNGASIMQQQTFASVGAA